MAQKKIALVHTSFAVLDLMNNLFDELLPDVKRVHIIEHSILQDVLDAGGVTPDVMRRMCGYFALAEATQADVIFNVCSSVGDTVDVARKFIKTPIVKIDEAMAMEAIAQGQQIGVLATLSSTLEPTCRLVEGVAAEAGKAAQLQRGLVEGAFEELIAGNTTVHDQMVQAKLKELVTKSDIIILAQASMARAIEALEPNEIAVPVLSSPRRGVLHLQKVLKELS